MPAGALRVHFHIGPALGRLRLPLGPTFVSAVLHVVLLAVVIFGASMWSDSRTKPVYVVLAPATAAIGSPKGVEMPPPRVEEPPAPRPPAPPAELPTREAPRELPSRELPARDHPPARDSLALPDRSLPPPSREPTRPRPSDKELPMLASRTPTPTESPTPARREPAAPPPQPIGSPTGSATGTGPLTLSVTDFPYAYYIRQVAGKIREKWDGKAIPGQQPAVIFEIGRDGRVGQATINKSSGNPAYDQVALRAINDAGPFPPLPDEFKKQVLRIGLQFVFDPTGG
ncbi:MAG TPA: TonB family protein [Methylomirabilota bacterium]|nr:TonB family protein [Methylomirabilota bacterium]